MGSRFRWRVLPLVVATLAASVIATLLTAAPALAAGEPTSLTVTPGDGTLTVAWTAPTDVTPVSYSVRHRQKGTSSWTTSAAINHPTLTLTLRDLTNGTAYEVEVSTSSPGPSNWVSAEGTPGVPATPAAPTLASGDGGLGVAWTTPAGNGSAITDYDVRHRRTGTRAWQILWDGGQAISSSTETEESDGPAGDPLDLGELSGASVTLTRESVGTKAGVYRLGSAVDGLFVRFNGTTQSQVTLDARYAATKPTATTLHTHGTELWSTTGSCFAGACFLNVSGVTPPLAAGAYVWLETSAATTFTSLNGTFRFDLATTATTRTISGLTNGNSYEVQVRASNAVGESAWSASAVLSAGVPDALAAPTVTPGAASLGVGWAAPSSTNGAAVTDYDVRYRADGTTTWTEWNATDTSTTTNANITGLTNGTTYHVSVRATNSRGDGPWSPSATMTAGAPAAPAALALTAGHQKLAVGWTAPAANGAAVTDYDVRYRADGTTTWTEWNATDTGTTASANITGLTNGTIYHVSVRAANSRGDGPWSPSVSAVPAAQRPSAPGAPTLVSGNTSLSASWTAPAANGSPITDYDVQYSSDSGATWTEWNAADTGTNASANITGLTNGTAYQVQVRAANSLGDGAWSASATLKAGLPAAPTPPTLTPGDSSMTAAWTAPSGNGAAVSGYDVRYSSDSGANWTSHAHTGTGTSATIPSLTNGTSYQVQVRAKNTVGNGPWSPSATMTVGAPAPPGAPTLTAGHQKLAVGWTAPAANGAAVTDYDVRYRADGTTTWTEWNAADTSTNASANITGLTNSTTYHVSVRAANSRGDGPWSPSASAAPAAQPPGAPTGPTLTKFTETFVWSHVDRARRQRRRGHHRLRRAVLLRQRRDLDRMEPHEHQFVYVLEPQ